MTVADSDGRPLLRTDLNASLPDAPAGAAQHLDCKSRETVLDIVWIMTLSTVGLMTISFVLDPQHGYRLRNVLDNAWAQQNDERRWLTLRDFDSEWWYARYLYSTLQPGMLVRTLRLVGSQASRKAQTPLLRPPFIERLKRDRAHRRRPDHEGRRGLRAARVPEHLRLRLGVPGDPSHCICGVERRAEFGTLGTRAGCFLALGSGLGLVGTASSRR